MLQQLRILQRTHATMTPSPGRRHAVRGHCFLSDTSTMLMSGGGGGGSGCEDDGHRLSTFFTVRNATRVQRLTFMHNQSTDGQLPAASHSPHAEKQMSAAVNGALTSVISIRVTLPLTTALMFHAVARSSSRPGGRGLMMSSQDHLEASSVELFFCSWSTSEELRLRQSQDPRSGLKNQLTMFLIHAFGSRRRCSEVVNVHVRAVSQCPLWAESGTGRAMILSGR